MLTLIDLAFKRTQVVVLTLIVLCIAGLSAYIDIPKEAEPDVPIPMIYVSMFHEGISPEDSERLLVQPMERELQSIEGLREMSAVGAEGYASITLEFDAGFDSEQAMLDVREHVDLARVELPPETDEPRVSEVNIAMFPVLSVALSGPLPERALVAIARDLEDKIKALNQVLDVEISGDREEMLEVVIDPSTLENYNLSFADINTLVSSNNQLIAAGALDTGAGRMVLKVPGVISEIEDMMTLPVKVDGDTVVTFQDVASIRRTYKDPESFARLNGESALVLEVSKRTGENIIETIEGVRAIIDQEQQYWPSQVAVTFLLDKSNDVKNMLGELQNNVITAVFLVMVVIVAALGVRPALLVGVAIPGSFLTGIMVINGMGLTMNIVVLFSLILVVGMLVDGAIVTIEKAERNLDEGMDDRTAFSAAAKRMAWPIIASTATTLSVFLPLLFWPGLIGNFMKYLPITVLITLTASLFMALIFVPVLGSLFGSSKKREKLTQPVEEIRLADKMTGLGGIYIGLLKLMLNRSGTVVFVAVIALIGSYVLYAVKGQGTEFFPGQDPNYVQVQIHARGDLSIFEKDDLLRSAERRLIGMEGVRANYSSTIGNPGSGAAADLVGTLQVEFMDWQERAPANELIEEVRVRLADLPGVRVQIMEEESGMGGGKPIQIELSSEDMTLLPDAVQLVLDEMDKIPGFIDIEDTRPLTGIEWQMNVNREEAARYGASVASLGSAVQMLTTGLQLAEYRPDDVDEELDIRLRYKADARNMEQLSQLRIPTASGQIPVSNFLEVVTAQKIGNITRVGGNRTMSIASNVDDDYLADDLVKALAEVLPGAGINPAVQVDFKGEQQDQQEAIDFLSKAFFTSIFLMLAILLIQFNSFYQALLILTAVIFSTAGVFLGLLITGNPFGVVMSGIGVIALAGIVVNNNIVLIDTFNEYKDKPDMDLKSAIVETCAQRLRPVMLTSITTILGLLPMVFGVSINLISRDVSIGAPSTQIWIQLSAAIAGGLFFATLLTLVLTPCMLMFPQVLRRFGGWLRKILMFIIGPLLGLFGRRRTA